MSDTDLAKLIRASADYVEAIRTWVGPWYVMPRVAPNRKVALLQAFLGLDHHQAICLLVPAHRVTSAAALLRPHYESLIRCLWVHRCCPDSEIRGLLEESSGYPPPKNMIESLKQLSPQSSDMLLRYHEGNWNAFNSLTHGGTLQLMRHLANGAHHSSGIDPDAIQVLMLSNGLTHNLLIELSALVRNMNIAEESRRYYKEYLAQFEGQLK
jgi:hypothetical protein